LFFVISGLSGLVCFDWLPANHSTNSVASRQSIRPAGGLRQPILGTASQNNIDAVVQANQMSDRHKHRLDPTSGPKDGADGVIAILYIGVAALFGMRIFIPARQSGFGTADGRPIQQQTDMTGEAAASRMGDTLPIENQQVRNSG
jgi:hypothetical protein